MRKFQFILLIAVLATLPFACTKTEHAAKEAASTISDASITASVKSKFAADDLVAARDINVTTDNGVVALTGKVNGQNEMDRAVEIAQNTEGVRTVRSYLSVDQASADLDKDLDGDGDTDNDFEESAERVGESAKEGLDKLADNTKEGLDKLGENTKEGLDKLGDKTQDATITAAIKLKFAGDDVVQASTIDVDTANGQVTLKGTVNSKQEEQKAIQLAKTVDGVTLVRSNLTIKTQ